MPPGLTRRQLLAAGGGTVALALGADGVTAGADCSEYATVATELTNVRSQNQFAESQIDDMTAEIDRLSEEVRQLRDQHRGPHPYDASARQAALEVGLDARPGVVLLEIEGEFSTASATAWFVEEHHLLTNAHNVDEVTSDSVLRGYTLDGTAFDFEVVDYVEGRNPDIAVLHTEQSAPTTLSTGSSNVDQGDHLVVVGHPGFFGNWVVTLGEYVGTDEFGSLQSTNPQLKGNSGSPVLDGDGLVVGVLYGGSSVGDHYQAGTRPEPDEPAVRQYPLVSEERATHVTIEEAMDRLEAWT